MKILKTILILTITISNLFSVAGQELRSLDYNPAILKAIKIGKTIKPGLKSATRVTSTGLDSEYFFEDFSGYNSSIYPSSSKWTDHSAYINSTYADSMISIGVATLDAYDKNGFPYNNSLGPCVPSDTLTSISISFSSAPTQPVFLGFFYEAGGKGDMPEEKDSLLVDFYSAPRSKWVNIWKIPGVTTQQHHFTQVILPVADSLLVSGFRFRFRNLTSLNIGIEDKQSNADQWNLDYIQLKHATNSDAMKYLNDIAIMEPLLPSLTEYTTVPWRHFSFAEATKRPNIPLKFNTCFPDTTHDIIVERSYISNNLVKHIQLNSSLPGGFENPVPPFDTLYYEDNFLTKFKNDPADTIAILELIAYLTPSITDQRKENDTVRRVEVYYNDYAYDDGSAEFGFGISGESQGSIQIANRYRIFRRSTDPDTLKAVKIYFNKTLNPNHITDIDFKVCVWKNNGLKPGELIYESSNIYHPDTAEVFAFKRIDLETPILVSDTIFVGIEQSSTSYINIGYDINFNSLQNIFVKTSLADWYNPYSLNPAGSLMIRPSFSNYDYPPMALEDFKTVSVMTVYPNPAQDILYIDYPDGIGSEMMNVKVVNTIGITLINTFTDTGTINISELNKGLYFLIVTSTDKKFRSTVKFLKN